MSALDTFWADQLNRAIASATALQDAITGLEAGTIQSYTLNTGQTTQTVTKKSISNLYSALDGALNRVATLDARVNGSSTNVVPSW